MKKYLYTLILAAVLFGCKDEPVQPPDDNNNTPQSISTNDIVMYEINIRAFSSSGTFSGIKERIDSIKALGINVIWLMPIHPVGQKNSVGQLGSPYSVKNYLEVNPEFGTLDDFINLLNAAHERKMFVIMDWVANHTAWDNPWIENKAWYTQDAQGNIVIPPGTNWQDVADLNYNNSEMRLSMIAAMKYWVTVVGIDGFRCDAADMIPYSFWKQAIDSLKNIPNENLILLAEGARADHFNAGFQMNYSWDFYSTLKNVFTQSYNASFIYSTHKTEYNQLTTGQKLRFTTNHDETAWDNPPIVIFGGKQGALAASAAAIFMGGIPLIYCGQEVGVTTQLPFFSRSPINWSQNPDMVASYKKLLSIHSIGTVFKNGALANRSDFDISAFTRTVADTTVFVIINTRKTNKIYTIPQEFQNINWTNKLSGSQITLSSSLELQPNEYLILMNK
ncbi:MAG: alpha-amylase family glycosyl hydrolase [bacterium]